MTARAQLEGELDHLQSMLPAWREKLRDEAQFWPQFEALVARIVDHAAAADMDFVQQRVERMLAQEGLWRPMARGVPPAPPLR